MSDLVGIVYNGQRPEYSALVDQIIDSLSSGSRAWSCSAAELDSLVDRLADTSVIITIGGDGTILRTVRVVAPRAVPILGVNKGRLGFMTELTDEEAIRRIPEYLGGDCWTEERTMLQASVYPGQATEPRLVFHALNDHVVGRASVARLVDVDLIVDGVALTRFRADAVIASTSTGSTAYAMSAGGPITHTNAKVFLIQPVAPHMGMRTGLVVSEESVIEFNLVGGQSGILSVDGFTDTGLDPDDRVVVQRSPHVARFLRSGPAPELYARLTERLGLSNWPQLGRPGG